MESLHSKVPGDRRTRGGITMKTTKEKILKIEKEHLDIYLGEVRFLKGYQGYDSFKVKLIELFKKEMEEIIGEDFPEVTIKTDNEEFDDLQRLINKGFNDFKALQREILEKKMDGL